LQSPTQVVTIGDSVGVRVGVSVGFSVEVTVEVPVGAFDGSAVGEADGRRVTVVVTLGVRERVADFLVGEGGEVGVQLGKGDRPSNRGSTVTCAYPLGWMQVDITETYN
jgi:hypothetical protein